MNIKNERLLEIARKSGASEASKGLWVISDKDIAKFSQLLIEEHENKLPKWMQATGYFCAITGFFFWVVYLGNNVLKN
jgi:hypothetical protein